MNNLKSKITKLNLRKNRIRSHLSGTTERPRMTVTISNMHVSVQIVDDTKHQTLVSITTVGQKNVKGNLTEKATWAGTEIAKKAKAKKITKVVLDRNGRKYHGRIKALADSARAGGLEF